ncbi:MAG: DUF4329 domain-containing protein [Shimia sp.]
MRLPTLLLCALPALATAQSAEEIEVAKATLSALQGPSFANGIEYCGYLAYDLNENLVATAAQAGDNESCLWDQDEGDLLLVLSYHTHGEFNEDFSSEVPSVSDIEADEAEGIDGFVATPGGRLWYVDTDEMQVRQICGLGCLPQDPDFIPGNDGPIAEVYTYQEMLDYEGG